jgi:hypothetical protein
VRFFIGFDIEVLNHLLQYCGPLDPDLMSSSKKSKKSLDSYYFVTSV